MLRARHIRHPVRAARGAEQLLRSHLDAIRRARVAQQAYKDDPRFRLDFVEQGFRSQISSSPSNERELLRRICAAYQRASNGPVAETYRPTKWWEAFRRTSLQPVIRALESSDLDALQRMYGNFFRDRCSDGLVGKSALLNSSLSRRLTRAHRSAYLSEALWQLDQWKTLTSHKHDLRDLSGPAFGNPFGIVLDGILIRAGATYQHYCANKVDSLLDATNSVVAEIGGGYGGMAYYLLRDRKGITYVNFDLPESLALAAYYLIKNFPEKRVLLWGERPAETLPPAGFDVVLLPLTQLPAMSANCADVVVSSHAVSDLDPEVLSIYLTRVNHMSRRYFFYQGMHRTSEGIEKKILVECPRFILKQQQRFAFSAQNDSDTLLELLYQKTGSCG